MLAAPTPGVTAARGPTVTSGAARSSAAAVGAAPSSAAAVGAAPDAGGPAPPRPPPPPAARRRGGPPLERRRRGRCPIEDCRRRPDLQVGRSSIRRQQSPCRANRQQDGQEAVDRRSVRHRGDVGPGEAVNGHRPTCGAKDPCGQVAGGIERAPEQRAADRAEVPPSSGVGLVLEERRVEPFRAGDIVIVEIAVLVVERDVVVEPQRPQV